MSFRPEGEIFAVQGLSRAEAGRFLVVPPRNDIEMRVPQKFKFHSVFSIVAMFLPLGLQDTLEILPPISNIGSSRVISFQPVTLGGTFQTVTCPCSDPTTNWSPPGCQDMLEIGPVRSSNNLG